MHLYLSPLLALLALAAIVDSTGPPVPLPVIPAALPLIDVSPPTLVVNPDQANCPLQIKLKKKPTGPVSLFMQASNMGFSSCELKFDENNWDKPQTVNAIPLPYFTDSTVNREVEGTFKLSAPKDTSMNKNELKYKITRDKGKGAVCQSNGDPHYVGFNGMRYDFLTCPGNFYLIKSKFLTIQTQTKKWINHAHVNEAMALRFGKTVYVLHADKGLSCVGGTDGVTVIQSADKKDIHFKLADGSEVKARINFAHMNYIDITVELAGHARGQVNGLCGTWDAANTQKFYGPDDKEVALPPEEWGKKWAVPADDNIFVCADKCAGSATGGYAVRPINFCQIPAIGEAKPDPPYVPPPPGYGPVPKPPAYGGGGYTVPPPIIPTTPPEPPKGATPEHTAKCQEICGKAIRHDLANKYLDSKPYVTFCVEDCKLAGSFDAVDPNKTSYFSKLRTIEKTLMGAAREARAKLNAAIVASQKKTCGVKVEAPSEEMKTQVEALYTEVKTLRNTYGLGGGLCPGSDPQPPRPKITYGAVFGKKHPRPKGPKWVGKLCNGNGSCGTAGCMCKKGWTGIACDINLGQGGYAVQGNVFSANAYTPAPPKPLPPCKQGALQAADNAAQVLNQIPSIAVAIINKQGGGTDVKVTINRRGEKKQ